MGSYQVQTRSSTEEFHDNPQLMSSKKTSLVLRDEWTGAGGKNRDLLLDFLNIIFAGLEIDLERPKVVKRTIGQRKRPVTRTCLIATISPVALSMALYTVPKLPPVACWSAVIGAMGSIGRQRLTAQLFHHLVVTCHIVLHFCRVQAVAGGLSAQVKNLGEIAQRNK